MDDPLDGCIKQPSLMERLRRKYMLTLQGEHLVVEVFTEPPQQILHFFIYCGG